VEASKIEEKPDQREFEIERKNGSEREIRMRGSSPSLKATVLHQCLNTKHISME
jgi:hypothetical protein